MMRRSVAVGLVAGVLALACLDALAQDAAIAPLWRVESGHAAVADAPEPFMVLVEPELATWMDRARVGFLVPAGVAGPGRRLRTDVVQAGRVVMALDAPDLTGRLVVASLPVRRLTPGDCSIQAVILNAANEEIHRATAELRVRGEDAPPWAARRWSQVELRQTGVSGVAVASWPIVAGIPLPRGVAGDPARLRLVDSGGRAIPAAFEALAHWDPSRDSVRWLRVAFNAPIQADGGAEYALKFDDPSPAPALTPAVRVTDRGDGVTVDTGVIAFDVSRRRGGLLDRVRRGGREAYRAGPGDGAYVVDHSGVAYAATADDQPAVTVEETGPMRACVRVAAWHVAPNGHRLNQSIIRYYAFAGQPFLRVDWTFVVTADTNRVRFRDIGLRFSASGPARLGLDGGKSHGLAEGYLLQKKHDLFVVREMRDGRFQDAAQGVRPAGWIAKDALAVTLRDFWQTFPRELEARPDGLVVHAWPGHGEHNQDWFIEPEMPPGEEVEAKDIVGVNGVRLTPEYFQMFQRYLHGPVMDLGLPGWWRQKGVAGGPDTKPNFLDAQQGAGHRAHEFFSIWNNAKVTEIATGTSRTQEMLLDFSGDAAETLAARSAVFAAEPGLWPKAADWLETTGVFGPVCSVAAESWREGSDEGWGRISRAGYYGLWVHGNMPEFWAPNGKPGLFRTFGGAPHYGYFNVEWLLYMATGRAEHLRRATANTRQWRDVSLVHYTSPDFAGLPPESRKVLGAANTVAPYPWRLGSCFTFYSGCSALLYDYYVTGARRSLEAAGVHVQGCLANASGRGFSREHGGHNKTLLDWYEHTWDPAVGATLDLTMAWIAANDPQAAKAKGPTPLNWTNFMPRYVELARAPGSGLTRRGVVEGYVLKWCEDFVGGENCGTMFGGPGNMLACAWFSTGDARYLHPWMRSVLKYDVPAEKRLRAPAGGMSAYYGWFDAVLYGYAAWREAVEKGLVPAHEGMLPLPPPIRTYRTPVEKSYIGARSTCLLLKEEGKEAAVAVGAIQPGTSLALYAPDGSRVFEGKTPKDAFAPVEVKTPADAPAGVYRLVIESEPYKFWAQTTPRCRHVIPAAEPMAIFGGNDWVFRVPEGVARFRAAASEGAFLVRPDWQKVPGRGDGKWFDVEVQPGHAGQFWRFRPVGHDSRLQLDGVPPYVSPHTDYWFEVK